MRAHFWRKLGLITAICLCAGAGIRGYLSRAAAGIALFERTCLPLAQHGDQNKVADTQGLVEVGMGALFADPDSQFAVSIGEKSCSVSDVLLALSPEDRVEFELLAVARVEALFPMLEEDHSHGLLTWDLFRLWAQFEMGNARRWGVTLSRFAAGKDGQTVLSVSIAPNRRG